MIVSNCALSMAGMALTSPSVAMASRDNNLYQRGKSNPNLKKFPMYHAGSAIVLESLDAGAFQTLFIQYSGCVWSEFDDGAQGQRSGCSADEGEEDWYMRKTGCFRANAAYSLYGIARGDEFSENEDACGEKHYVNSFFTNYGVWSFINALDLNSDDFGVSFECKLEEDGEKSDYGENNAPIYPNSTSYTTACTTAGTLIQARFKGAYCNGRNFAGVIDTMDEMNAAIANITRDTCLKIYSNPSSNINSITNSIDYGYDTADFMASLYTLFFYSFVCNFYEYPDRCPDPHGLKRDIDSAMLPKPLGWAAKVNFFHWTKLLIYIFILGGTLLKVRTSIIDGTVEDMPKRRKRRMEQLERQGRTPKDTIESQVREAGEYLERTFSLGYRALTFPKRRDQE